MKIDSIIRIIAGTLVLLSLGLAYFNPWWLGLAAFVGLNLIQSAFTGFCLAEIMINYWWGNGGTQEEPPASVGHF